MRILVVDDEQHLAELFATMLTDDGHSVETATNGDHAFHIYCERLDEGKCFDFVLTGLEQPGMDGVALMRAIWKKNPNQRLGLCTAYPVLRKPFDNSQLLAFVKQN